MRRRLLTLVAAVVATWLGIAFLIAELQWKSGDLRAHLKELELESYRIGDEFRDHLRVLNESLYRYGTSHSAADVADFNSASHELDLWIDQQKPLLKTAQEKVIMDQIDTGYDDYLQVTKEFLARFADHGDAVATMNDYTGVRMSAQKLFRLGENLTQAHLAYRDQLMTGASVVNTDLRILVLVVLGLLCVTSLALAFFVYHDMIEPLRIRLVESQNLLERQEKLASLGTLAAGVAHEIRNPLTAINAALFVQKKKFPEGSPERGGVETVEREISRLEGIVNNFLQFARPAEPDFTLMPADLLLFDSQKFFSLQLEKNHIQLDVEPVEPLLVRVDAGQFKQVLLNLIQNAADSIGRHGRITLRARPERRVLADGETDVAIIEVADTGKGIPPEVEKRLFDPFFTTKENGSGLGLSIAARIVERHGGQLQYQTEVNRGTTFGIILPRMTQ